MKHDLQLDFLHDRPLKLVIILVLALVAHVLLRRLVTVVCRRIGQGAGGSRQAARMNTLAGVGRSAVAILVWTWALITALSTVGVNVAPLIASAGVVGVALGFGAQTLVKDFLTGIFMLVEDQYGVGDTITVGDVTGEVEQVTLRVTTLRDATGTRWYVRHGQITQVGNMTQQYAVARVDVPVGLSNTVEDVLAALGDAAEKTVAQPKVKDAVVGEPVVDGVVAVETDHMVVRVHVRTQPGQQWAVQRALLAEIIPALKRQSVSTAYPFGVGITPPSDS